MQIAVFVDAGYLYAQGSALLTGQKQRRETIRLSVKDVLKRLAEEAEQAAPGTRLLRIYWYDGLPRANRPTPEQNEISYASDVKLRLGMVNNQGQQKGVDSLIVTDLIELARNRAISDALILSGDEDIRIGVQVAQTFGVRLHLLGIKPASASQSPDLIQESDTHREWDKRTVSQWMEVNAATPEPVRAHSLPSRARDVGLAQSTGFGADAEAETKSTIASLETPDVERIVRYLDTNRDLIPPEIDRPTLARLRNRLGRDLTDWERKEFRRIFASELRAAIYGNVDSPESSSS
ncbi:MAG: NYN domain-containing protein [Rhodospirillaceae bacterium]|nr:NYN domain-containing protein [Rhodospirillaceae bacterium]MDE0703379.1 NYN domain-containing protein [Rhodospirillaceae bacterium]MXW91301.1 NYN domain-containing protein [Rhodospirillaceae bacterium]MYB12198.1 NYN domain-containing protein [Rhodospirillaceae bacterium]MYI50354.1 NYN domain-containing protein [Rhodospirillaceae bacterium]